MKNALLAAILSVGLASALPLAAHAHGEAGLMFSATSTLEDGRPYQVDVDYAEAAIVADSFGRFDFNLFEDATRQKGVSYTDLWVRIREEDSDGKRGRTLYAGSVAKAQFGGTGFSFAFPRGGKYALSVRYNDANKGEFGDTVAKAEFSLDVLRGYDENKFNFGAEFWVGLLAGLFGAIILVLPTLVRRKRT
ncbi:MAG: hypothetical protein ACYCZ0_02815 [Minisyncoccota bacterium]